MKGLYPHNPSCVSGIEAYGTKGELFPPSKLNPGMKTFASVRRDNKWTGYRVNGPWRRNMTPVINFHCFNFKFTILLLCV